MTPEPLRIQIEIRVDLPEVPDGIAAPETQIARPRTETLATPETHQWDPPYESAG